MANPKFFNRVMLASTTTGTGTYSLGSAVDGYQSFDGAGADSGDVCAFVAVDDLTAPTNWEICEGTFTAGSPATLTRTTIIASSNGGLAVSWPAGTRYIFSAPSAERLIVGPKATVVDGNLLAWDGTDGGHVKDSGVSFPSSSTAGNVPKFSDTTGKVLADGYGVGTSANDLVQMNSDANWPAGFPVPVGAARNLKVVQASATTLTVTADEIVCKAAKGGAARIISSLDVTLDIGTTGADGMDTGSASASADLSLYAISGDDESDAVLACLGSVSNGEVYSGSDMPTGYTASALIGSYKMNASAQFDGFLQRGRNIEIAAASALSGGTASSYTSVSLSSIVPANAQAVSGHFKGDATGSSSNGGFEGFVAGNASGYGEKVVGTRVVTNSTNVSPVDAYGSFSDVIMETAQSLYYKVTPIANSTAANLDVHISGYTF